MDTGHNTETTRLLCQAYSNQIRELQNVLQDITKQVLQSLDENNPEQAQMQWKQVVQTTQQISRLFNQTSRVFQQQSGSPYRSPRYQRSNKGSRGFHVSSGGRQGSFHLPDNPSELNRIISEASRKLAVAAG